jgi:hypothetical protein
LEAELSCLFAEAHFGSPVCFFIATVKVHALEVSESGCARKL